LPSASRLLPSDSLANCVLVADLSSVSGNFKEPILFGT